MKNKTVLVIEDNELNLKLVRSLLKLGHYQAIEAVDAEQFAARLRQADCPVIGRIQDNRLLIDPRTVFPHQGQILIQALLKEHSQNE